MLSDSQKSYSYNLWKLHKRMIVIMLFMCKYLSTSYYQKARIWLQTIKEDEKQRLF